MIDRFLINNVRNIVEAELSFWPCFNFIQGENGCGKTSILESIYLLSRGFSFRTTNPRRLIQYEKNSATVAGNVKKDTSVDITLGVQKHVDGVTEYRFQGKSEKSAALFLETLPVLLVHSGTFDILEAGPAVRRQFLDWGVFHVEHHFLSLWRRFQRALKQRNAALQANWSERLVKTWDPELIETAESIDILRSNYLTVLTPLIRVAFEELTQALSVDISYYRGWSREKSFKEALESSFLADKERGYTSVGPQRADMFLKMRGHPVHTLLSRGQQKLLVYALKLAQGQYLYASKGVASLYLLDDMLAELDETHQLLLLSALEKIRSQVFLTGISLEVLLKKYDFEQNYRMFHVEQGKIQQI